jgi:hypothetical protein
VRQALSMSIFVGAPASVHAENFYEADENVFYEASNGLDFQGDSKLSDGAMNEQKNKAIVKASRKWLRPTDSITKHPK